MSNPLQRLHDLGQSVWYDELSRRLLLDGTLFNLIHNGEITGVTTNPTILKKAFLGSSIYTPAIESAKLRNMEVYEIYKTLITEDIRATADLLRNVYDSSDGIDGYVSVEVSPHLAFDAAGTVKEAKELFADINRPNVLIKIPATPAGLVAMKQLIAEGINVNVTLLFSENVYQQTALAYIEGLEQREADGKPLNRVFSVASFFVSRWDTLVDRALDYIASTRGSDAEASKLRGKTGVTLARLLYRKYQSIFASDRFLKLSAKGARPQRLLWASTGTKDPAYSDVYYVEQLIAPGTVATLPPHTLAAFRDHGQVMPMPEVDKAIDVQVIERLKSYGIDFSSAAQKLMEDGLNSFVHAYDDLLQSLASKACAY